MADDLKDLASKIQRARENARVLTPTDLENLADRITEAGKRSRIDPKVLANTIARTTASSITSKIPSVSDIAGAFLDSSPILKIATTIFSKSFSGVSDLLSSSRSDNSQEAEELLAEIEKLREEMAKGDEQAETQFETQEKPILDEQTEILQEILKQNKILNGMAHDEDRQRNFDRLQALDNNEEKVSIKDPNESVNKLLGKMLVLQEKSLAMSIVQSISGFFTGFGAKMSGMLGGLLAGSGGIGAVLATLTRGVAVAGRLAIPLGLIVTAAWQFYEGFESAASFLGDENATLFEKIRYAATHVVSALLAPVDWAIEYFTGEESNVRAKFETIAWEFQESVIKFIQPALDLGLDAIKWVASVISDVFKGINMDTKLVDLPGIMADNIAGLFIRAWNSIDVDAVVTQVSEKLQEGGDFATNLYESILKTTTDWFKNLYDNMLEWIATGLEENLGETFGGFLSSKTRDLKTAGNAPAQKTEEGLWSGIGNRIVDTSTEWLSDVKTSLSNSVMDYTTAMNQRVAESILNANERLRENSLNNSDTNVQRTVQSAPPVVQQNNVTNSTTHVSRGMQVDPPGFGYNTLIPSW